MDKVNEFEHGEDRRPYNVSKSFQQLYGPEANFSYRAHTADEILSDVKKLQEMIRDHYEKQCPRLAALDDYMKARNTGIYNDENRRVEEGKADHRAAHNFAKIINVFDVGYNTGIPIKKSSDNEKINEMVTEYDKLNDVESLDSELWRDFKKYGRAYELQYRNRADEDRSVISNAFETFVCYGLDVERTTLLCSAIPKMPDRHPGGSDGQCLHGQGNHHISADHYGSAETGRGEKRATLLGRSSDHGVLPDRYRQSGFEDVIPLIDLYDAAQSDTSNYMTDLNEATLVVSGDLDLSKYTVKEVVEMKKANLLLLANGVNPDGSKSQTDAKYIYKQYDVSGTEAYKERLQGDIHKISFVPDLTDESFSRESVRRSYEI